MDQWTNGLIVGVEQELVGRKGNLGETSNSVEVYFLPFLFNPYWRVSTGDSSVKCQSLSTDVPQYRFSHRYILVGVVFNQQFLQVFYGREVFALPISENCNSI